VLYCVNFKIMVTTKLNQRIHKWINRLIYGYLWILLDKNYP
jgi:hypothetical protein